MDKKRDITTKEEQKITVIETACISHSTNTLGKGMNPIILPPTKGN